MKLGRNDICHCGSGKKYKKCCLDKDQEVKTLPFSLPSHDEAKRLSQRIEQEVFDDDLNDLDDEFIDDEEDIFDDDEFDDDNFEDDESDDDESDDDEDEEDNEELNAAREDHYDAFTEKDYQGKIQCFIETLDKPELMDSEMASDMLDDLFSATIENNERPRFQQLVDMLRERLPKVYKKESVYLLKKCLANALVAQDLTSVATLFNMMSERPDQDIDPYHNTIRQLAYHGHLDILLPGMRAAWPKVRKSKNIMAYGIDEFALESVFFEIYAYVQENPNADFDETLYQRTSQYISIERPRFQNFLDYLTGRVAGQWQLADFDIKPKEFKREENYAVDSPSNVFKFCNLLVKFIRYLHYQEGLPLTRVEMMKDELLAYLVERHTGDLKPSRDLFDTDNKKDKKKNKKDKQSQAGAKLDPVTNFLCPDHTTLDHYIAKQLHFFNPQLYAATAAIMVVPYWLKFLHQLKLIDAAQREATLQNLKGIDTELLKILGSSGYDPFLKAEIESWRKISHEEHEEHED